MRLARPPPSRLRCKAAAHPPLPDGQIPRPDRGPARARAVCRAPSSVPAPAERAWLIGAHDPAYVDAVLACRVPAAIEREIGFAVDRRVSRRAQLRRQARCSPRGWRCAHGIACNAAGGSHHARRAQGAGFCTLNDVAVAARLCSPSGAVGQVLVVDLDVHQGDGTADILRRRAARLHLLDARRAQLSRCARSRPDLDIGAARRTGDADYLDACGRAAGTRRRPAPDLVFYNAGVDPHADDRLGRMQLTDGGLRAAGQHWSSGISAAAASRFAG